MRLLAATLGRVEVRGRSVARLARCCAWSMRLLAVAARRVEVRRGPASLAWRGVRIVGLLATALCRVEVWALRCLLAWPGGLRQQRATVGRNRLGGRSAHTHQDRHASQGPRDGHTRSPLRVAAEIGDRDGL